MREMKDSGIEWIGAIPADWTLQCGKTIFAQRLTKGNQSEILLAATQKYGMLPQSEVEGVVQVKEDADLQQFRTVHKKDFVISLRSFQGGFEYSQYEGVCSPAYQVFYNTTPICHNYYRLLFKSDGFIQKMNSMTVGIREGKNIQYSDFANSLKPTVFLAGRGCLKLSSALKKSTRSACAPLCKKGLQRAKTASPVLARNPLMPTHWQPTRR